LYRLNPKAINTAVYLLYSVQVHWKAGSWRKQ
jgi:hypothetical protein